MSCYHEWTIDGSEWNKVTWNISEVESESQVYCMFIPLSTDKGYFDGTPLWDIDGKLHVRQAQGDVGYVFCSQSPFSLKIEQINENSGLKAQQREPIPITIDVTSAETYEANGITWHISLYCNTLMLPSFSGIQRMQIGDRDTVIVTPYYTEWEYTKMETAEVDYTKAAFEYFMQDVK